MNITLEKATFTDPSGQRRTFDQFFVQERLVRYVQIPSQIDIRQALIQASAGPRKNSQIQLSKERQSILRKREKRRKEDAARAFKS